jgi:hypothetical protein
MVSHPSSKGNVMSTISTTASRERDRLRSLVVPTGIATVVVSSVFTYLGAHSRGEYVSMIALALVTAVVAYGWVAPRALERNAAPKTAMVMSVVAALTALPAYWTGLPLVLGAAGGLVGYAGRGAAKGAGLSIAAMLVGVLSVLGYLTIYIVDGLVFGNSL